MKTPKMPDARVSRLSPGRIALGYAVIAILWIAFSDAVVTHLKLHPAVMTVKGTVFVFVTASLLYFTIRRLVRAIQQTSQELGQSEAYLAEAQKLSHTGSWAFDVASSRYVYVSEECCRIFGLDPKEGLPTREMVFRRIHPDDSERVNQAFQKSIHEKVNSSDEFRIVLPDGTVKHIYSIHHPVFNASGELTEVFGTNVDITEHKRAEEASRRLHRELLALSKCNQVLLRVTEERDLVERICRIMCEEAGYRMAFVAYAELDEAKTVRPVAWTGAEEGYLATVGLTWADVECGRGPTGTAIRCGKTCCIQDLATDPRMMPWREALLQRGFRSGIGLPLRDEEGNAFGSLTIHSAESNAFTPEEVRLLEELADDLAFGIVTIRSRVARTRAEEALRRSEAYLAEAQRLSHTGSYAGDPTTRPIYWSEELYRIFGFDPRHGVPGFHERLERIHPEDRDRFLEAYHGAIRERADIEVEYRILLPDGTVKHVRGTAHPVLNASGDLVEVVGTVVDITERKQAEESLRESEMRFRTFVDHVGDALFVYDLEQRTIVDVNRSACESLGYTRQELIGNTPDAFHLDSDRAHMDSILQRAKAGESVFDRHWHQRKDGSTFPVEAHTSLVSYGGCGFLLKVCRDITDRLGAEEQREKLRQLEADLAHINRVSMLGELAASISHELHQPIAAAILHADLAMRFLERKPPDLAQVRQRMSTVIEMDTLASEIIDRLRSLYKKEPPKREPLAVNELIGEMLELLRGQAMRHGASVRTDLADDLPNVMADRVQIQQVLMNLMLNGIEAMSDMGGGVLTVKSQLRDDRQIQISVSDTGPGLPPGKADQIFDAFFTTKPQGSGMGLAISKTIVESHGGRIWADDSRERGATFHFALPSVPGEPTTFRSVPMEHESRSSNISLV